ncbi:MAG: response regulator [Elusimicrobia bacterium]|nr:response regulator [Elusimicrobiota bacterium]
MPTILVIDDDKNYYDLFLERHLTLLGFIVFGVRNSEQGLEFSKNIRPDLILLGWRIKNGFSGEESLRSFKSLTAMKNIPVVVMSEIKGRLEVELRARRAGAAQFITRNEIVDADEDKQVLARRLQSLILDKQRVSSSARAMRRRTRSLDSTAMPTRSSRRAEAVRDAPD